MEVVKRVLYQPKDVALMRTLLEEAATILPAHKRTPAMKTNLATRILASAAKGERDPAPLRMAALMERADE